MPRKCCFGCSSHDLTLHRFPNIKKNLEMFKMWVYRVGGKLDTPSDYEYYSKKRVCDIHFAVEGRTIYSRLHPLAMPSINLFANTSSSDVLDHGPNSSKTNDAYILYYVPSTSQQSLNKENENFEISLNQESTMMMIDVAENDVSIEHSYSMISKPVSRNKKKVARKAKCAPVRFLSDKMKYLRKEICRLSIGNRTFKARLLSAQKLSDDLVFKQVIDNMTSPAQLFMQLQLQKWIKPKSRRFSIEEKIQSFTMYIQKPKCYALLHKIFTLPSVKAMKCLLGQIHLEPGINPIIFNKIRKTVLEKEKSERLCSLIFDEMSVTPQLYYNTQKDSFEGFVTNGNGNTFAENVIVFMVKGLKHNFIQPIAYYFTSCLNKIELKMLLMTVVKNVYDSGLIIINTVCNQSSVNVGAITELINETKAMYLQGDKEWRYDSININGHKIIPLYDAACLIRGIRNNLLTKNMAYTMNNQEKIVKWKYFEMVYAADKWYGELRLLLKLTDEHVNPEKINKMRVKTATQIFSHNVAVVTEHLTARGDLPGECRQLIDITILLDNLFDSLNVNTSHIPNGNIYKGPVRRQSPHHALWQKSKDTLKTVFFLQSKKVGDKIQLIKSTAPAVINLIKTIEGMEEIWKILNLKYEFDAMQTKKFSQDPIKIFFKNIRSYGARNNGVNTVAFEGAFKALLLNNYNAPHTKQFICEDDVSELLQSLEFFVKERSSISAHSNDAQEEINCNAGIIVYNLNEAGQRNYTLCGWVVTKCLKNIVKSCQHCQRNLLDTGDKNPNIDFKKIKRFCNGRWLCYPNEKIANCFLAVRNLIISLLENDNILKKNMKKHIKFTADLLIQFPFTCTTHKNELEKYFLKESINIILQSWCRSVNRNLSGKMHYAGEDCTKTAAVTYYNKYHTIENNNTA